MFGVGCLFAGLLEMRRIRVLLQSFVEATSESLVQHGLCKWDTWHYPIAGDAPLPRVRVWSSKVVSIFEFQMVVGGLSLVLYNTASL